MDIGEYEDEVIVEVPVTTEQPEEIPQEQEEPTNV
jgi:hypothetical protein